MLKGTALRRVVISLMETGRHPMTVFTMSLWTKIQRHARVYPLFHWKKLCVVPVLLFRQSSSISFHRVLEYFICTCQFLVLVPEVSLQLLVPCVPSADGDVVFSTNLRWCTGSILDTSVLVYGGRRGSCWPGRRPIRYGIVTCFRARYNLAETILLQVEHVAVEFIVEPFRPSGPCLGTMKIFAQWSRVYTMQLFQQ